MKATHGRIVTNPSPHPDFRLFRPPTASPIPLAIAPRLWSWDHAGHPAQTRLATFLDHVESRLQEAGVPSQPLAIQINVALSPGADLFSSGDLDNYLIPIVLRLGGDRVVSAWATKSHGGTSTIQVEAAHEARAESVTDWHFARAIARGSADNKDWKCQIRDQVAAQCELAPEGPLEMQISYRVGPGRRWNNVWKQSIDALGPILGLTTPGNPFHPLDGRIIRLGVHHTVAADIGFDVELGIWWRAVAGAARNVARDAVSKAAIAPHPILRAMCQPSHR